MIQSPTIDEAIRAGLGPALSQGEITRLLATIAPAMSVTEPLATTTNRLMAFTAWSFWFFGWIKGRMNNVFVEAEFHAIIRRLQTGNLPQLLDAQAQVWEDKDSLVKGFDLVFCDGHTLTWPGLDGFFHVPTSQFLTIPNQPPLEKLGMDATVLFTRCMNRVETNRKKEAEDGNSGDTAKAKAESKDQGSSGGS